MKIRAGNVGTVIVVSWIAHPSVEPTTAHDIELSQCRLWTYAACLIRKEVPALKRMPCADLFDVWHLNIRAIGKGE
jgi:hypothetical protein